MDNPKEEEPVVITVRKSNKKEEEKPENKEVLEDSVKDSKIENSEGVKVEIKPETTMEENKSPEIKEEVKEEKVTSTEDVKDWLKDVKPNTTVDNQKSRGVNIKVILVILGLIAFIGVVVGGIFYYRSKINSSINEGDNTDSEVTVTPTIEVTPTPTPEAITETDLSKLSVNVLNGTGIPGEATKVKESLTAVGFKTFTVGNAKTYDFKDTEVQVKEGLSEAVYNKVVSALEGTYTVVKVKETLATTSKVDLIITIGVKK